MFISFLLAGILFIIALYLFFCYLNYRIVAKFRPGTTYLEMIIPIYNYYRMVELVIAKPMVYIFFMLLVPFCLSLAGYKEAGQLVASGFLAYVLGRIAQQLGRNFWLFLILALIPLVDIVALLILAFDASKPIHSEKI